MSATLVTIATDGFRNYVDLPDGRQLNLGSVSVLNLVTALVSTRWECRKALDGFLSKGSATIKVNIEALEDLLKPRKARWAGSDDSFIAPNFRQHLRGTRMTIAQDIDTKLGQLECLVASAQQQAQQGQTQDEDKTASMLAISNKLLRLATQNPADPIEVKLSGIEVTVDGLTKALKAGGTAPLAAWTFLQKAAAGLREYVGASSVDENVKQELSLYIDHDPKLAHQKQDTIRNMIGKVKTGSRDATDLKLWSYLVDKAASSYVREFGLEESLFSPSLRESLAKDLVASEHAKIVAGAYSNAKFAEDQQQQSGDQQQGGQDKQAQGTDNGGPNPKEEDPYKGKDLSDNSTYYKLAQDTDNGGPKPKEEDPYKGKDLSDNSTYYKLAASDLPVIHEALTHLVMAKIDGALQVVDASEHVDATLAKNDLHILSTKLAKLIEASDLGNPNLGSELHKLAGLADKVHSHFAAKGV